MEVTQLNHANTHAIVGGQVAQSFTVNANAEFFEMLSSTIYPNKMLAVVREVICNGWDAHLAAGRTDIPLEITLTKTQMSFRDFGLGLSTTAIVPIYCSYGGSTKVHDGVQTGGFGIGSKAPFAYSKHFTVISCHNGERMIYAASRGSAETNGCPDFRQMLPKPIPTTESGIEVSVPIQDVRDVERFEELIRDIVFYGGIRAKLNGVELPRAEYDKAEAGFMLCGSAGRHNLSTRVYLRYGSVVYPVDLERVFDSKELREVIDLLSRKLARVILTAPGNSVSIAPSRETLSYSNNTIETVRKLIDQLREDMTEVLKDTDDLRKDLWVRNAVKQLSVSSFQAPTSYAALRAYEHHQSANAIEGMDYLPGSQLEKIDIPSRTVVMSRDGIREAVARSRRITFSDLPLKDRMSATLEVLHKFREIHADKGAYLRVIDTVLKEQNAAAEEAARSRQSHYSAEKALNMQIASHCAPAKILKLAMERLGERVYFGINARLSKAMLRAGLTGYDAIWCEGSSTASGVGALSERCPQEIENRRRLAYDPLAPSRRVVILGPSLAAARRLVASDRGLNIQSPYSINRLRNRSNMIVEALGDMVFFIKTRKATDTKKLTEELRRNGFSEVHDAVAHVATRKKACASEKLMVVHADGKQTVWDGKKKLVYAWGSARHELPDQVSMNMAPELSSAIHRLHPKGVAVVLNAADAKIAEKAGMKNAIHSVIADCHAILSADPAHLLLLGVIAASKGHLRDVFVRGGDDPRALQALLDMEKHSNAMNIFASVLGNENECRATVTLLRSLDPTIPAVSDDAYARVSGAINLLRSIFDARGQGRGFQHSIEPMVDLHCRAFEIMQEALRVLAWAQPINRHARTPIHFARDILNYVTADTVMVSSAMLHTLGETTRYEFTLSGASKKDAA